MSTSTCWNLIAAESWSIVSAAYRSAIFINALVRIKRLSCEHGIDGFRKRSYIRPRANNGQKDRIFIRSTLQDRITALRTLSQEVDLFAEQVSARTVPTCSACRIMMNVSVLGGKEENTSGLVEFGIVIRALNLV
ncbi:hypothetical protein TNCV_2944641 [Trichonephila clavipes]|nr:hypothetical protein TNCV_2944641 [Trichonephila clavipes]